MPALLPLSSVMIEAKLAKKRCLLLEIQSFDPIEGAVENHCVLLKPLKSTKLIGLLDRVYKFVGGDVPNANL